MSYLELFLLLTARKATVRGSEYHQCFHEAGRKGYLDYLMMCALYLMSHSSIFCIQYREKEVTLRSAFVTRG